MFSAATETYVAWIALLLLGCGGLLRACGNAVRWENDYRVALRRTVREHETDGQRHDGFY